VSLFYVTTWTRYHSITERSAKTSIWRLPNDDEHVLNTGSPEDLLIDPEDIDIEVSRVQESSTVWSPQSFEDTEWEVSDFYTATWSAETLEDIDWAIDSVYTSQFYVSEI